MDLKNLDKEHGLTVDKWLSGSVAAAALKGEVYLCQCIPEFREAWDQIGYGTIDRYLGKSFECRREPSPGLVRAGLCLWDRARLLWNALTQGTVGHGCVRTSGPWAMPYWTEPSPWK